MSRKILSVELIGHYGGDEEHALSAWTSTRRELDDDRRARMKDMLFTLAANGHHTPFEKSVLHFLVRCDIASHIHIIKHRIGVSVNAESARYKELRDDDYYVPGDLPDVVQEYMVGAMEAQLKDYHELMDLMQQAGVPRKRAKESARFLRPYGSMITQDVAFNFRSFMHFIGLRMETHAQVEIQEIAAMMLREVTILPGKPFDLSLQAFGHNRDYHV